MPSLPRQVFLLRWERSQMSDRAAGRRMTPRRSAPGDVRTQTPRIVPAQAKMNTLSATSVSRSPPSIRMDRLFS